MIGDKARLGFGVLARATSFVVACGVGLLATGGYNALPAGALTVVAGLILTFGIPQLVAIGVALRVRRRGEAVAILSGALVASFLGVACTQVLTALHASVPLLCGMYAFVAFFVLGFTAVANGVVALSATALAIHLAGTQGVEDSTSAPTPN